MSNSSESSNKGWSRLSEDWWSVIIALILTFLVYVKVLGKVPW